MLDIGLVGLGPDWETLYKPVLIRLRPRLRVRAVHSAVATKAEPVAAEFDCRPASSITSLVERPDLKAIVVLETGWGGAVPVELACDHGKPVFFANAGGLPREWIARLSERSARSGVMLMPDLRFRYLPATIRLRELIATKLGRPLAIEACLPKCEAGRRDKDRIEIRPVEVLDWFRALAGTAPSSPLPDGLVDRGEGFECQIEFSRPAKGGAPIRCRLSSQRPHSDATVVGSVEATIHCVNGWARISHPTTIEWACHAEQAAGNVPSCREALTGERGDLELMLDHFARRVAGGLVPVPTFEDLENAWRLYDGQ